MLGTGTASGAGEHWWSQRLTAVALVPLGLWLAIGLALLPDFAYATVMQWAQRPVTSILLSHGSIVATALGTAAGGASWLPSWATASRSAEQV